MDRQLPPAASPPPRLARRGQDDDLSTFEHLEAPEPYTGVTPTVRARLVDSARALAIGSRYEMEWAEDESTTMTWGDERLSREAVTRVVSNYRIVPEYTPQPSQPQVYEPVQSYAAPPQLRTDQVVRYELPPPALASSSYASAAPIADEEFEPARVWSRRVWTVLGAVGLFGAVLFMRLIVSDGTGAVRTSAEPARATSAALSAAAAPSAPNAHAPEAAAPERAAVRIDAAEPAAPKVAARSLAPKLAPPKHAPKLVTSKSPPPKHAAKPAPKPEKPVVRAAIKSPAPALRGGASSDHGAAPALRGGAVKDGTLRVNSLPWAEVFVDGRFVGNTPQASLLLPAGRHKVKLVNTPLEMSKTFSVELEPGQVVTKIVNLSQ